MMFTKLLRLTLVEKEMIAKELAAKIGTTQQNLSAKMKRDNFSEKEMRQIADALGLDLEIVMKEKK
jgi:DNA-binding Xre family transcriptional regulator